MSQTQKRDISSFFKPYSRMIPQKRSLPAVDDDEDTIVVKIASTSPTNKAPTKRTPLKDVTPSRSSRSSKPARPSPLQTPKSGRSMSIPYRSPVFNKNSSRTSAAGQKLLDVLSGSKPIIPSSHQSVSFEFPDIKPHSGKISTYREVTEIRDSDEDGSSSLESLVDIFDRNKKDDATSNSSPPNESPERREADRLRIAQVYTNSRSAPLVSKQKMRQLFARERETKFDLSGVLDDHFEDEQAEHDIARARENYQTSTEEFQRSRQMEFDKKLLASIVRNDEDGTDNVSRLLHAVERTEALEVEKSFSFFGPDGMNDWSDEPAFRRDFPSDMIPDSAWLPGDSDAQTRAFLSGWLTDSASNGALQDQAIRWVFESITEEPRDDLRHAYIRCVEVASTRWTRTNLTAADIQTIFQSLNADPKIIRDGQKIEPTWRPKRRPSKRDPKYLLAALKLFFSVSQDMDFSALSKICSIISRLALDEDVMSDGNISIAVEELLEKLCNLSNPQSRSHVHERIMSDLGRHLGDPGLQARFLNHLIPTSSFLASLRTSLAAIFLLGPQREGDDETHVLSRLTQHISKSPFFSVVDTGAGSAAPDYVALGNRIHVLDAAVADGHRPYPFLTPEDERDFNASVDKFADQLHRIFVSIADTGASHMRRTEAKDALQALEYRVLYSVRTKPRRKKHVFDAATGKARDGVEYDDEIKSKDFMAKFLVKRTENNMAEAEKPARTASAIGLG